MVTAAWPRTFRCWFPLDGRFLRRLGSRRVVRVIWLIISNGRCHCWGSGSLWDSRSRWRFIGLERTSFPPWNHPQAECPRHWHQTPTVSGTAVLSSAPSPSTSEPVPCPSSLSPPPVEGQNESLCERPVGTQFWSDGRWDFQHYVTVSTLTLIPLRDSSINSRA